jgi:GT2 family glycosyltransferase
MFVINWFGNNYMFVINQMPYVREIKNDSIVTVTSTLPFNSNKRLAIRGKFLFAGDEKFYLRGVTYGTFADGEYDAAKVARDFRKMAENNVNAVRVYTVPPLWLLDLAQENGLRVMIGLPWEQHVAFLDNPKIVRSIENQVRAGVAACANHPAILCFVIGNEIPAAVVRWHGKKKIERFLRRLYQIVKTIDASAPVTYVNFPSTEYLDLSFVDFVCFNVYLEQRENYEAYLARLQNIAGDRPLVLAEIGLDSRRNSLENQADALDWQIRAAFAGGAAGAFVFAWTDEWWRGGAEIEDWDFGLTTRERKAKPALSIVKKAFAEIPFPADFPFPKMSVVVCSYNGSRTIRETLEGLQKLDYPAFEVIVVNDGSTDDTPQIVAEFPAFKLISTNNQGLSAARNVGMRVATGEIVVYTDDDAHPDPHWLKYLAASFVNTNHAGIGGPNLAPHGDGEIAQCVANAPGGPIHVLLSDTEAEHIPGCNMAFRRETLLAIGGFDEQFRAAGDDVDVCWRIQEKGWTLGFSPAATVWHRRRNSIRDYWKQQQGYGKAEALLERKWADKYNAAGHLTWAGRLYGKGLTEVLYLRRGRVYQGVWGSAPFKSIYEPANGLIESLPLMPEWYLITAILAALCLMGVFWQPLFWFLPFLFATIAVPFAQAILSGFRAHFVTDAAVPISRAKKLKLRFLTAFLHLIQPLARLKGRLRHGLTPWRRRGADYFVFPSGKILSYWCENWRDSAERLTDLETELKATGAIARRNGDFEEHWDLFVRGGMFGGAKTLILSEEHGQGRQMVRWRVSPHVSPLSLAVVGGSFLLMILALLDEEQSVGIALALLALIVFLRIVVETGCAKATLLYCIERVRTAENGVLLSSNKSNKQARQAAEVEAETERQFEQSW